MLRLDQFQRDSQTDIYLPPEQKVFNYSDGPIEDYILSSVNQTKDLSDGSDELASKAKDWASYYHLAVGRSNVFKGLDLPSTSNVLELGCGCGAITRYLAENCCWVDAVEGSHRRALVARSRCRDLDNVRIFSSDFKQLELEPKYDIVTLIGVMEYAPIYFDIGETPADRCAALLNWASSALKDGGTLLIAIENKIGLKFWGGCPEEHTGQLFDGIHGYPNPGTPVTFSKKEIENLLNSVGFTNKAVYSCFPDYKFAQTMFSPLPHDSSLYLHNWISVPFSLHGQKRSYTFHEGLVVKTLNQSGLLPEFANSFLVVAAKSDNAGICMPEWVAKNFSYQRRKPYRCVTTFYLRPTPMIKKERVLNVKDDITTEEHGLCLTHRVADAPWVDGDLLSYEFYEVSMQRDFRQAMLKKFVPYAKELIERFSTGEKDFEGYPILDGPAIDFIPRNIIKKDGKLLAIDEEWIAKVSADFVLFRSLKHDVLLPQSNWIRKGPKNMKNLSIQLIQEIFPTYNRKRHKKNKALEKTFQLIVTDKTKTD